MKAKAPKAKRKNDAAATAAVARPDERPPGKKKARKLKGGPAEGLTVGSKAKKAKPNAGRLRVRKRKDLLVAAPEKGAPSAKKRARKPARPSPKIVTAQKLARKLGAAAPLAQVAAIVVNTRFGDRRCLMVTSRETHRWIIPKGWPMKGRKPWEAAALEARQEVGIVGQVGKRPIGTYTYFKRRDATFDFCEVQVFVLEAERQLPTWREKGERQLQWMSPHEAADAVDEPGLADLIRQWGDVAA